MGVASVTGAIVNQIRMGWKAPPSSICPVCSMSAFPAESYMAADRTPYHRACLKCNKCCKRLTPSSMAEHDKMSYCDHFFCRKRFCARIWAHSLRKKKREKKCMKYLQL